ncbi:MAG: branched-chain amino acid ABC transporter permease [Afipia sp.]|nr:branched-chain amino acid ABC transporter permease [Afipia sp.]
MSALRKTRVASTSVASSALLCAGAMTVIWGATITFLMIHNEYLSILLAAVSIGTIEAIRRFVPNSLNSITQSVANRSEIVVGVSLVALVALPFLLQSNAYWIHILTMVFIFGFAAQGLNIHLGEIGAINVGYAGFFAIGAYSASIIMVDYGSTFWMSLIYATAICWFTGLLVGACTIRTTGDYLSLVTLGFGLIVYQLAVNMTWLTHGTDGVHVPKPQFFGHGFDRPIDLGFVHLPKESNFYFLGLLCLVLAMLVSHRMTKSWIGRTWAAMRQDPLGAGCFGINVPIMQVLSFAFGAAFAGVAGALYAGEIGFIEPGEFTIFMSITLICMVILGGMGNWWGVVIGAFIMIVVPEKLRDFQEMRYFLYGIVLLVILIHRPYGLFASTRRKFEKLIG